MYGRKVYEEALWFSLRIVLDFRLFSKRTKVYLDMTKTFYGDLCMGFFGTLYHEFLWDFVDFF